MEGCRSPQQSQGVGAGMAHPADERGTQPTAAASTSTSASTAASNPLPAHHTAPHPLPPARPRERGESLGWITESSVQPKRQRVIEGVGASSLVDLRAALYRTQEESKRAREEGGDARAGRRGGGGVGGGAASDVLEQRNVGVEERAHRDVLQLKASRDVTGHLERKSLLYEQLVRGEAPDREEEGKEAYSVDFLRKGTLEDERLGMMAAEQGVILGGWDGGSGSGSGTTAEGRRERVDGQISAAAGALDGQGIPPSHKQLVKEVVQETKEARERAATLKKKREEQAERKREMLKAAFLKKQLQKLKAKQSTKQGKPPSEGE